MPNEIPYMPLWVTDYQRGTKTMSHKDKGLYMDFLIELWIEGQLPHDFKKLSMIFGIRESVLCRNFTQIAHKFTITDTTITHNRITFERNKTLNKIKINRENGKKGGRPKKEKKPAGFDSDNPEKSHTESESDTESDKKKKEQKENEGQKRNRELREWAESGDES